MLSVIIPIYNMAETLDRCVESIIGQGCDEMEIILVDDGSSDGSGSKCDEWGRRDSRIKVLHTPNGGLSNARNAGIEVSAGEYVTFVDADDYVGSDTYRPLMNILSEHPEYDILEFPVCCYYGSPRQEMLSFGEKAYTNMVDYWLDECVYKHTYAWNKLYRRALFDSVRFPVGKVFEDAQTLPLLLKNSKVVATTNTGLYYYVSNPYGITATAKGEEYEMLLDAHLRVINELPRTERLQPYYLYALNLQLVACALTGKPPRLFGQKIRHPFAVKPLKMKIKSIALNVLGINKLCKLYSLIANMPN